MTPAPDFALALERRESGTAVLVLGGELDLYRAPEIEDALADLIEPERESNRREETDDALCADGDHSRDEQVRCVAVDLCSVTFLDVTTLTLLVDASRRQRARGGELLILVGPQTPMRAFEVTGIDRLLAISRMDADATGSPA